MARVSLLDAPEHLPWEVFLACPTGRRPRGRPRTRWSDYVTWLARERLGILPEELEEVSGVREVWASLHQTVTPATLPRISRRKWVDGWMDIHIICQVHVKLMPEHLTLPKIQIKAHFYNWEHAYIHSNTPTCSQILTKKGTS